MFTMRNAFDVLLDGGELPTPVFVQKLEAKEFDPELCEVEEKRLQDMIRELKLQIKQLKAENEELKLAAAQTRKTSLPEPKKRFSKNNTLRRSGRGRGRPRSASGTSMGTAFPPKGDDAGGALGSSSAGFPTVGSPSPAADGEHSCAASQRLVEVEEQLAHKVKLVFNQIKAKLDHLHAQQQVAVVAVAAPEVPVEVIEEPPATIEALDDGSGLGELDPGFQVAEMRAKFMDKSNELAEDFLMKSMRQEEVHQRGIAGLRDIAEQKTSECEELTRKLSDALALVEEVKARRDAVTNDMHDLRVEFEALKRTGGSRRDQDVGLLSPRSQQDHTLEMFSSPQLNEYKSAISQMQALKERSKILNTWATEEYKFPSWSDVGGTYCHFVEAINGYNMETGTDLAKYDFNFIEPQKRIPYFTEFLNDKLPVQHFMGSIEGKKLKFLITVEVATTVNPGLPLLALVQSKKAAHRCVVNCSGSSVNKKVHELMETISGDEFEGLQVHRIGDEVLQHQLSGMLVQFEKMHLDLDRKVGVLYWKAGQTENQAMNNDMSPSLDEFCKVLGDRITLKGWTSFRGGLNVTRDETGVESVFTRHQQFSIMYHVSALLNKDGSEQQLSRKRHIGNDLVVVIFWEGEGVFNPELVISQMCTVFIVVSPTPDGCYKVCVTCKPGVPPFPPFLPNPPIFDGDDLFHEWLMAKMINGERAAFNARVFQMKTQDARQALLAKMFEHAEAKAKPIKVLVPPAFVLTGDEEKVKCVKAVPHPAPGALELKKGDLLSITSKINDSTWEGLRLTPPYLRGQVSATGVTSMERKKKAKRNTTSIASPSPLAIDIPAPMASHKFSCGIRLLSGKGLPVKDMMTSDPYCKLCVMSADGKRDEATSSVQKSTLDPIWGDSFVWGLSEPSWEILRIDVFDWNRMGSHDPMGCAEVSFDDLSRVKTMTLTLVPQKDEAVSGSLEITIEFYREILK